MILLVPMLLSILVAMLRGGNLLALAEVHFRHSWLILTGLLVQVLIFSSWWESIPACTAWTPHVYALSMVLLLLVVGLNRSVPGMAFLGMGLFLNTLTIWVNGGRMPASLWALQTAGFLPVGDVAPFWQSNNSILMDENSHLRFLCDVFALPKSWPLTNIFSIGDVLVSLGGVIFIQKTVAPSPPLDTPLPPNYQT